MEYDEVRGRACAAFTAGRTVHSALQSGQLWLPCATLAEMQLRWKAWEHSAVKLAWPRTMPPRQIAHTSASLESAMDQRKDWI
jgi:hypothetical protein